MTDPKPFASLSSGLLARKGGARPAMRSPLQPQWPTSPHFNEATARQIEDDLGWNDMGHDLPEPPAPADKVAPEVVPLKPAASLLPPEAPKPAKVAAPKVPEVVRQQEEIAARVSEAAAKAPKAEAPKVSAPKAPKTDDSAAVRRSALSDGRRAAFTLRLDAERHLKLRLACTIANRSAQQIVTDALDQFIAGLPDVATLAAQVKKRG